MAILRFVNHVCIYVYKLKVCETKFSYVEIKIQGY
jgi:hypothetical protein